MLTSRVVLLDFVVKEGNSYIETFRTEAKIFFTDAELKVRNTILPVNAKTETISTATKSSNTNVMQSLQGSYSSNLIKQSSQGSSTAATAAPADLNSKSSDLFSQFGKDVIEPAFEKLAQALGKDADDFIKLITDMSMDNLRILIADAIDGLIEVLATVFDGLLKFLEDIIKDIAESLTEVIDTPIIRAL